VKLYQKQFEEYFSLFLKLRHGELVSGGQMVLTFLGRKNTDVVRGEVSYMWGLLAQALQSLVEQVSYQHQQNKTVGFSEG
jgi:anthranilate O-methyltransferase